MLQSLLGCIWNRPTIIGHKGFWKIIHVIMCQGLYKLWIIQNIVLNHWHCGLLFSSAQRQGPPPRARARKRWGPRWEPPWAARDQSRKWQIKLRLTNHSSPPTALPNAVKISCLTGSHTRLITSECIISLYRAVRALSSGQRVDEQQITSYYIIHWCIVSYYFVAW